MDCHAEKRGNKGTKGGCGGGNTGTALSEVTLSGLYLDSEIPFKARAGKCQRSGKPIDFYVNLRFLDNVPQVKNWLKKTRRGLSININTKALGIKFYKKGTLKNSMPECRTRTNHTVFLVGWGKGYWYIRNSWGLRSGDKGHFRVDITERQLMGSKQTCICGYKGMTGKQNGCRFISIDATS